MEFLRGAYYAFTDLLEREAGRIVIGFALMFVGVGFWALKVPKGDDVIISGLTLIGRELMSGNKKDSQ